MNTRPVLDALAALDGYATIDTYGAQSAVARRLGVPQSTVHRAAKGASSLDIVIGWATSQGLTVTIAPGGTTVATP